MSHHYLIEYRIIPSYMILSERKSGKMAPLKSLLVESLSGAPHPTPGKNRQALGYFNGVRIGGEGEKLTHVRS